MLYTLLLVPFYLAIRVTIVNCALEVNSYTTALNEKPQDPAPSEAWEELPDYSRLKAQTDTEAGDQKPGSGDLTSAKLIETVIESGQRLGEFVISFSEKLTENLHNALSTGYRADLDDTKSSPSFWNKTLSDVFHDLAKVAQTLRGSLVKSLKQQDIKSLTEQLSDRIRIIWEKLAAEFPDPITQFTNPQEREAPRAAILNRTFSGVKELIISIVTREPGSFERHIREYSHLFFTCAIRLLIILVKVMEGAPFIVKIAFGFILPIMFILILPRFFLRLLGFGELGPVKGSFAARTQSRRYGRSGVEAGSWFAKFQSKAAR